jgi:hypothetical protein
MLNNNSKASATSTETQMKLRYSSEDELNDDEIHDFFKPATEKPKEKPLTILGLRSTEGSSSPSFYTTSSPSPTKQTVVYTRKKTARKLDMSMESHDIYDEEKTKQTNASSHVTNILSTEISGV